MRKFIRYFLQGLIFIAPVAITIYIIYNLITFVDGMLEAPIVELFGKHIPGLGLVTIIISISLFGVLSSTFIFKPVLRATESLISKTPLVKIIYSSLRDLFSAFMSEKSAFKKAVLVDINKDSNLQKLGFVTEEDLSKLGIAEGKVAVYLPHSYNFSGNLFIVSAKNVSPIEGANSTDVMKFIVSGGVTKI